MAETVNLPNPKDRNLFFNRQVNQSSVNDLCKNLVDISEHDQYIKKIYEAHDLIYVPKPIKIYVDSYGGYVYQCLGLIGIMETCKTEIHTIVTGCAISCGFLIAISGHKRFGYDRSTYLYHQVAGGAFGKVKDIEEELLEILRLQETTEDITLRKTSISKKMLEKVYKGKKDWYMDSREALKLGVIDEIIK
jgi:ATP-dependent Clp protease protease subunit